MEERSGNGICGSKGMMPLVTRGAIPAQLKWESVSDSRKAGLSPLGGEGMLSFLCFCLLLKPGVNPVLKRVSYVLSLPI